MMRRVVLEKDYAFGECSRAVHITFSLFLFYRVLPPVRVSIAPREIESSVVLRSGNEQVGSSMSSVLARDTNL